MAAEATAATAGTGSGSDPWTGTSLQRFQEVDSFSEPRRLARRGHERDVVQADSTERQAT